MSLTYHYVDAAQTVIVCSDGRSIPCDPDNVDYAALVGASAAIEPFTPPAPAPALDPVAKLTAFLNANPDVKALLGI